MTLDMCINGLSPTINNLYLPLGFGCSILRKFLLLLGNLLTRAGGGRQGKLNYVEDSYWPA